MPDQVHRNHATPSGGEWAQHVPMEVGPCWVAMHEHNRFAIRGSLLGMSDPDGRTVLSRDGRVVGFEIPTRQAFKVGIRGAQDFHHSLPPCEATAFLICSTVT